MNRPSELRVWLILLSAAVALIVACSSSSTTGTGDEKDAAHDDVQVMTKS
jgi:hypothetical protein